jgi:hypothetical protein
MVFTYAAPPQSPRDEVRFLLGDTVEKPHSISDEDLDYLLSFPDATTESAAAHAAERIADWWMTNAGAVGGDKKVGPFSISRRDGNDMAAAWRDKARALRAGSTGGGVAIDIETLVPTRPPIQFAIGMHDNAPGQNLGGDRNLPPELGGFRAR